MYTFDLLPHIELIRIQVSGHLSRQDYIELFNAISDLEDTTRYHRFIDISELDVSQLDFSIIPRVSAFKRPALWTENQHRKLAIHADSELLFDVCRMFCLAFDRPWITAKPFNELQACADFLEVSVNDLKTP